MRGTSTYELFGSDSDDDVAVFSTNSPQARRAALKATRGASATIDANLAAAAAARAMKRHECCKSQFKFRCFSCGEFINRGDNITRCNMATTGMTLRYRGADADRGLTMDETVFYQAETGSRMWVHIGCIPCYWDSLPPTSNEYSRPCLRPICTDWGVKVYGEFEEWAGNDEVCHQRGVPYFCMVKGYPKEKFMRDRIIRTVTRFQALWRGYIYKKAYPIARRQARATEAINETGRATLSTHLRCSQNARARDEFHNQNSIGAQMEILMDKNHPSAAIYSAEVIKIQDAFSGLYYWIKFHHDDEIRVYHWSRLHGLKHECETFKSKHGILAQVKGKLPLYPFLYP